MIIDYNGVKSYFNLYQKQRFNVYDYHYHQTLNLYFNKIHTTTD